MHDRSFSVNHRSRQALACLVLLREIRGGRSAIFARATMPDPRPPDHLRRARVAKRVQVLLALASAGFVLYRLLAVFMPRSGIGR